MTLRAKSRAGQWIGWLAVALVACAAYVVLSRLLYGAFNVNLLEPRQYRIALPLFLFAIYLAWEMRWDGVWRVKATPPAAEPTADEAAVVVPAAVPSDQTRRAFVPARKEERRMRPSFPSAESSRSSEPDESGESLFARARAMNHGPIPDFRRDGKYLALLGKAAAKGCAPAMVKLGEYAMRRRAWVEAYFWMTQARRNGMHRLDPTLREIRKNWAADGFPRQSSNVSEIFPAEAGAIGRALLRVATGHEAGRAKDFLRTNHPDYLPI